MSAEVLEKVNQLPPEKQAAVEDYINYLLRQYAQQAETQEDIAAKRRANMGRLKGQIWMAPDFDETPEDFKDYV